MGAPDGRAVLTMTVVDDQEDRMSRDSKFRSRADRASDVAKLERELDREIEEMNSPEQQKAVDSLFEVDGNELGRAALDAARSRGQ